MTRAPTGQPAETALAVLHRAAGTWRGVIAAFRADRPTIIAWRRFEGDAEEQLDRWLDEHHVGSVIGVLPAAAVICRTCSLPNADSGPLQQALQLQAEAHLTSVAPGHRQAMAVLDVAEGETSRSGILLAWPEAAQPPLPPTQRTMTFAPDVAALAALLNGERPSEPLLWIDGSDGSVALAISHASGAVLRAAHEDAQSPQAWRESVCRVLAETALSVGHAGSFTESLVDAAAAKMATLEQEAALLVPPRIIDCARARLEIADDSIGDDPTWWQEYGVAVGVLLATTDQLKPLTQLQAAAPVVTPSPGHRFFHRLSNPNTAVKLVALSVLLVCLGPLLGSGLRLMLLNAKLPDLETQLAAARQAESQLAMYGALQDKSWPMAKLLADMACNTPQGISLDQIRIRHGERASVSGRAKPKDDRSAQEVVALMQENLRHSGIFNEIILNWGDRDTFGAYEFTLSAKVVRPYRRYEYPPELDFGEQPLAERLYGPPPESESDTPMGHTAATDASAMGAPDDNAAVDDTGKPDEVARSSPQDDPDMAGDDSPIVRLPKDPVRFPGREPLSRGTDRSSGGGAIPRSHDIPEEMTDGQIAALSLADANEARARIAQARQQAVLDEETRERLRREFRRLSERIRELRKPNAK